MIRNDSGKHYRFEYKGIKLDPARIFSIYDVTNALQIAIVKKGLLAGKRGKKSLVEDINDIITACERWKEMIEEDDQEKSNEYSSI
jgi:succinyl-CoA synthetase beta subunit